MRPYDLRRSIQFVSTAATLAALTVWAVLSELLLPATVKGGTKAAILVLSTAGAYQLIFQVAYWALRTKASRLIVDRDRLSGTWHQVFTVSGIATDYRFGKVNVVADSNGILMSGESYRADSSFSSHWQSRAVVVEDSRLHVFFTSSGLRRGTTSGVMSFLMVGPRPMEIVGIFADSAPGTASGEIRLFRDPLDADAHRQAIHGAVP